MDVLDSARLLGRYAKAQQSFNYSHVGNGPYAIVTEFDDATRYVSFLGFESAQHAEVYAEFLRGQLSLEAPVRPDVFMIHGVLAFAPPTGQRQVVAFRVAALIEAVPVAALSQIGGGYST